MSRRWVFLGEGLPSIALALVLPCLLPGGPARLKPGRLLSQEELQLLRADVSTTHAQADAAAMPVTVMIKQCAVSRQVAAVNHSWGAVTTLFAACPVGTVRCSLVGQSNQASELLCQPGAVAAGTTSSHCTQLQNSAGTGKV